jgi:hypothetical protein
MVSRLRGSVAAPRDAAVEAMGKIRRRDVTLRNRRQYSLQSILVSNRHRETRVQDRNENRATSPRDRCRSKMRVPP